MCYIDLPGIRTHPENLRKSTHELVEKYLSDPQTIVMWCVEVIIIGLCPLSLLAFTAHANSIVPAMERLNADQALGIVVAKKKAPQTILVLSKCDQVKPALFERSVVKRLLGEDDETPALGLAGCIATSCRDQDDEGDDEYALSEAGNKEKTWLRKLFAPLTKHSSVGDIRAKVGVSHDVLTFLSNTQ